MLEFDSGIIRSELPVYGGSNLIAFILKSSNFSFEGLLVRYPSVKAYPAEHTELDFGHVEPTAMLGRVVKLQPSGDASRFFGFKGLIERCDFVSVEVVKHHADYLGLWVRIVDQPLHLLGKVDCCALIGHFHVPITPQGLEEHKPPSGCHCAGIHSHSAMGIRAYSA